MKHVPRPAYLAGALSMLLSLATASLPARADAPLTDGPICQFAAVGDPTAEAGSETGQLSGGPVLLTEQDGTTPEDGTLTCRVQVDQADHTGSGPSVSGHGTGVLTAGPSVINYTAADTSNVYLCSEFTDDSDGVTYYWNDDLGEWSTSSVTPCLLAVGSGDPSEEETLVDSLVCPVLAIVFPPEGDIVVPVVGAVWDCPPYGNLGRSPDGGQGNGRGRGHGGSSTGHDSPAPAPVPDTPVYPTGTITIASATPGGLSVTYGSFNPPFYQWTCSPQPATTITCTPPAPAPGFTNVCGTVSVDARNGGGGVVSGSSHCSSGPGALAASFGPTATPTHDSASQDTTFPWTCEAVPNQSLPGPWEVTCAVGS